MAVIWKGKSSLFTLGVNTVLVEQPDSPEIVFADKFSATRKFKGLHSLCVSSAPFPYSAGSGVMSGWMVKQSKVSRESKGIGTLTIEYVGTTDIAGGAVLPQDTYGLHPFEVNPKLEQHPLFATLTREDRAAVRTAVDSQTGTARDDAYAGLGTLAAQLADKLLEGKETYYLAGWTYEWTSYFWALPTISDGGFIETPGGPLAGLLGTGIDWLRKADDHEFDGVQHKLTSAWLGGPSGHWDADLY